MCAVLWDGADLSMSICHLLICLFLCLFFYNTQHTHAPICSSTIQLLRGWVDGWGQTEQKEYQLSKELSTCHRLFEDEDWVWTDKEVDLGSSCSSSIHLLRHPLPWAAQSDGDKGAEREVLVVDSLQTVTRLFSIAMSRQMGMAWDGMTLMRWHGMRSSRRACWLAG